MALRKMLLYINGAERQIVCEPTDTLADVVRALGLSGTKVGCGVGQCGTCSVLVDGKVTKACTKKMDKVDEHSRILTIEGIGTPTALHPLQQAWMSYGGAQCGYCSPGFIVSAKALLDSNPNPTRQEVRAWFQKQRNACRCTGYKPLVDAVMAAAKVLRGEMKMKDLEFRMPADGRIYGTAFPRPSALAKVTGTCDYGSDVNAKMPPGTAYHAALALAKVSSAKVSNIDVSEAEKMPGVVKVVTKKDVKGSNLMFNLNIMNPRYTGNMFERPILVDNLVYQYGDVYAIVLADSRKHARAAAEKVKVTQEVLPAYMNALEAVAPDAKQVFEGFDNLYVMAPLLKGQDDLDGVFGKSAHVLEGSYYSQRQPHAVLEPDTLLAYMDEDGKYTCHCKSLLIHAAAAAVLAGAGLAEMRIINNPVGASFGYSLSSNNIALATVASQAVDGFPVCLDLDYDEHTVCTGKRAPGWTNIKLGCDKEGKITGLQYELLYDHGAYADVASLLIEKGIRFMGWPYAIPNIKGVAMVTASNHSFTTAFRAFGAMQAYAGHEQLIDELAEKAGIDPFEFRYKNVLRKGDLGVTSNRLSVYPMEKLMDMMRSKYQEAVKRAKKESTAEKKRGVGISCGGYSVGRGMGDQSEVDLELNPDGTVTNFNGWEDQGQGGDVGAFVETHEALRPLGLRPDQIRLVMGDTKVCPNTGASAGSSNHYMHGKACIDAANKLMNAMRKPDGTFRTYDEMKKEGIPTKYRGVHPTLGTTQDIDPNTGHGSPNPEYNYAVFLSEVEVDVKTGKTRVLKMTGNFDVGVIGNRLAVEGQAYGGMAQAIGMALSEDFEDPTKDINLVKLGIPFIDDVPDDLELNFLETPRPTGPFGAAGCAECFITGFPSVINAIYNAVGVRIHELPARPAKVLKAMKDLEAGKAGKPKKYWLGMEFKDRMQYIKDRPMKGTGFDISAEGGLRKEE